VVNVDKEEEVELILNGLDLTCSNYAPIVVTQAGEVTIDLAEGSINKITDAEEYELLDDEDTTDAAIFSRDDLKLKGDGTLYIYGNYRHGIVAKDDLKIKGGTYIIQATEDGVNANDSITVDDGTFYINAGDDGMHVDEVFTINDADIVIADSYEGLEGHQVIINGGVIDITASDDGINSNSGGSDSTSSNSSDDAEFTPGNMDNSDFNPDNMDKPDDANMPDNGGQMPDGTDMPDNASIPDGTDMSGNKPDMGNGGFGGRGFGGGGMMMDTDSDSLIQINGGTITVNAGGDGLDSNGVLEINGGAIYVSGATNDGDSAIDYGTQAYINGGSVIAAGYSGMVEQFSDESEQCSVIYNDAETISEGTLVTLTDEAGTELIRYEVPKSCNCITVSTEDMVVGESYTLHIGEESIELEVTDVINSAGDGNGRMNGGMNGGKNGGMR
jgi:hypothetical protein